VSASQQPESLFGNKNVAGGGGWNNGQPFYSFLGAGSNAFPGNFASTLPSAFTYWGQIGPDFNVAVQAAEQDSRVTVLSRPRIQTSHAVEARIFVGETVPFINGTVFGAYGGTGSQSSYNMENVGINLDVTPYINPDGLVVMDIAQTVSQLGTPVQIDGNPVPTTTERDANATVAVKDGQTIMLGGFISTTKTKSKSGVPFLSDIPLLGKLFTSNSDQNQRVELIVLIRPTVLPTPEAAAETAEAERKALPNVRRAEREIQRENDRLLKQEEGDFPEDSPRKAKPMDTTRDQNGYLPAPE